MLTNQELGAISIGLKSGENWGNGPHYKSLYFLIMVTLLSSEHKSCDSPQYLSISKIGVSSIKIHVHI